MMPSPRSENTRASRMVASLGRNPPAGDSARFGGKMRFLFGPAFLDQARLEFMDTPLVNGPAGAAARLILAHGAGASMTSPFLETLAADRAALGVQTVRFEFAYMAARRSGGPRRPPPPVERLAQEYLTFVGQLGRLPAQRLYIGGKSMGGRVASMIADELYGAGLVSGLAVLGYPFHPAGKPHVLRVAHLKGLGCPALIVQGTRDALGSSEVIPGYGLSPMIRLAFLPDGDHDLKPRRGSGHTQAGHIHSAARELARFMGVEGPQ
jgi:uncharacterized protein